MAFVQTARFEFRILEDVQVGTKDLFVLFKLLVYRSGISLEYSGTDSTYDLTIYTTASLFVYPQDRLILDFVLIQSLLSKHYIMAFA